MKRFILFLICFLFTSAVFADENGLSRQATAFYSDNNHTRTMDLILQINENDRTAQDWVLLGNVLADKGEIDNAVYMYQKAIENDPKAYKAYYNLGNYYVSRGQFDLAIGHYKKAIKIKSDNPYIYYNLATTYIKTNNLGQAKANLNKAIMYKSTVPEFHYNLAYVYKKLGKDKLAQTYLDNYNKLISSY
ncbi:tetratricopeptide repeat protein [bacterium]|nr:tetratricopeptide repeat protein [bacterium]